MSLQVPLMIHNSLTGKIEEFRPIDPKNIKVYCCGPTLYGKLHVGNWRTFLVADIIVSLLRMKYGENSVTYARNITDVDDKIIERAKKQGVSCKEIVEKAGKEMNEYNSPTPHPMTHQPKVTDHIDDIKTMIDLLIDKGHAYQVQNHVFFDVKTDPKYHLLSKRKINDQMTGARVPQNLLKRNYQDFVLWKPVKEKSTSSPKNEPTEPAWESPWSLGRPGWHIGCSVIVKKCLGEQIDIHIGGQDLIFPHHTNEMSQSRCAHGKELANFWIHVAPVTYEGKKLSRSEGAILGIRDIPSLNRLLRRHYKKPLDISLIHAPLGEIELPQLPTVEPRLSYLSKSDYEHCIEPLFQNLNVELFAQRLEHLSL